MASGRHSYTAESYDNIFRYALPHMLQLETLFQQYDGSIHTVQGPRPGNATRGIAMLANCPALYLLADFKHSIFARSRYGFAGLAQGSVLRYSQRAQRFSVRLALVDRNGAHCKNSR